MKIYKDEKIDGHDLKKEMDSLAVCCCARRDVIITAAKNLRFRVQVPSGARSLKRDGGGGGWVIHYSGWKNVMAEGKYPSSGISKTPSQQLACSEGYGFTGHCHHVSVQAPPENHSLYSIEVSLVRC